MGVLITESSVVTSGTTTTDALGAFFTVSGTSNPTYLVVDALDRDEYTVAGNGDTGAFTGNGNTLDLSAIGGDGRGAGIVFTWQAATHQYVNATYGTFSALDFTSSDCYDDVTSVSVFTTTSAPLAQADANNAYALIQADPTGYVGSVTFANDPNAGGTAPAQATPDGVAAAAMHFVGDAWNENGCWVLASTIAAEAGAGLPVHSTDIDIPGRANGEWVVVYDGPAGAGGNWQNMVTTGDIVAFQTASGGGHITTCVSGSGGTAMLVDNITYENQNGTIANTAHDGSANDILVSPPHPASQEWQGVSGRDVVISALDPPVISDKATSAKVSVGGTLALGTLFSGTDPTGKPITEYQIYNSASSDTILLSGKAQAGATATRPVTATSLSTLSLLAGTAAATDTLEIRAFNGTYWGDWQSLNVNVVVPPPVLSSATPAQSWTQGSKVNFILPATSFKDPAGGALTYGATGTAGASLPPWLSFNPATRAFTGTVPAGLESFSIVVTATDTVGLSTSETFAVKVPAAAPVVSAATPAQSWAEGGALRYALPSGTFTDPQGENLTYKASLSTGAALPSWLKFNASTAIFAGTAPASASTLQIKVTATDSGGLSVFEIFSATIAKGGGQLISLGDWQPESPVKAETDAAPAGGVASHGGAELPVIAVGPAHHIGFLLGHGTV
jgi:hypothetical protein